jgi:hypothetical protein
MCCVFYQHRPNIENPLLKMLSKCHSGQYPIGSMPRSLRIQYSGAFYHVMARGNRREMIVGFFEGGERGLREDRLAKIMPGMNGT